MSYCRWSSDDFQCDVYVYEDVCGGWTTHVADRRRVIPADVLASLPVGNTDDVMTYFARNSALMQWMDNNEAGYVQLPEPNAGQSFNDDTPGACADRLEALRTEGFNVPQYAIDELRAEAEPTP